MVITDQCVRANMLPTWRKLHLSHIAQLRMMIREGRQVSDAKACLKRAQNSAALARRQWVRAA
jgi:hypothetical protein